MAVDLTTVEQLQELEKQLKAEGFRANKVTATFLSLLSTHQVRSLEGVMLA